MSLIEGIGDELTITVSIFVVFLTLIAAWVSTRVSDNRLTHSQLSGLHIELNQLTQSQHRQSNQAGDAEHSEGSLEQVPQDTSFQSSATALPEEVQNEENSHSQAQAKCEETPDSLTESGPPQPSENFSENSAIGHEVDDSNETVISVESLSTEDVSSPECIVRKRTPTNGVDTSEGRSVKIERTESKTENRTPVRGDISLKIKFLNETERVVHTSIEETVGNFKRLNFSEENRDGKVVHLIFNGQFLRDDNRQLGSYSIVNNCVLHCHISQHQQSPGSTSEQPEQGELDLGQFMVPLFACTIGFVWYLRWQYSYMFNTMSTMSLSAVTVLFMLAVLAAWRG